MILEAILAGMVGGLAYGIVGYVRNKSEEDFDWQKFGVSVIASGIIGGYAGWAGLAVDVVSASAIGVVVTQTVAKLFSAVKEYYDKSMTGA